MHLNAETAAAPQSFPVAAATDASLLAAMAEGDQAALSSFYSRHSKRIYSVAFRILRDPGAAEDILQEIIMQVWRDPASFASIQGSLEGWLAVVTRNRAIDVIRVRKPTDPLDGLAIASSQNFAAEVEDSIAVEEIRKIVATLPEEQRTTVEMAYFKGLSHSEIAKLTGDPLGTVKTRIRVALQTIRRSFVQRPLAA